jgi:NADH-quinone oxidoreductase subunit M
MHTRELGRMGGLWSTIPVMSGAGLFFVLASLGLPGLGNFIAEFLVLLGAFRTNATLAVLAAIGILAGTVYGLKLMQKSFHGPNLNGWKLPDLSLRELLPVAVMALVLIWLGLYPQPVLDAFAPAAQGLQRVSQTAAAP